MPTSILQEPSSRDPDFDTSDLPSRVTFLDVIAEEEAISDVLGPVSPLSSASEVQPSRTDENSVEEKDIENFQVQV